MKNNTMIPHVIIGLSFFLLLATGCNRREITVSQYQIKEIQPSAEAPRGSMLGGTGDQMISSLKGIRRDHKGNLTLSQLESGAYIASAVLPDEMIYNEMESFTSLNFILPAGEGSKYRFKGEVKGFYEGYTFIGNEENPLEMTLQKEGLTYTGGMGTILIGEERIVHLVPKE